MSLWLIFITGLTTGGLSCVALQGGLLASVIANQKKIPDEGDQPINNWQPVAMFLVSKLVAHILIGFGLGWLGSMVALTVPVRLLFQTLAALFMVATAANLLELHPIFRYVALQPPKFVQRLVRKSSKSEVFLAPAILGVLTILIPCGVTQAMQVLAITSGNPVMGALIMGAFVLGTLPVFGLVGLATSALSDQFQARFMKVAAGLLVLLAIFNLNGVLVVLNSPLTLGTVVRPVEYFFSSQRFRETNQLENPTDVQRVLINVTSHGYSPKKLQVKAGIPVELTVQSQDTYSCASEFMLPEFKVQLRLKPTDKQTVSFTPTQPGQYRYTCSMGMHTGILEVL